ncbi:MAG: type II toxin-antitoxin system VapC family toxin [Conexibacter sp.]
MRLLLDSHVVLWLITSAPGRLSDGVEALVDEANDALVSAISVWELEIKRLKGQLDAPPDLLDLIEGAGFRLLNLTPDNALDAARLPRHHGDPFDRLLVAQAQGEAATLVTADDALAAYDVPIMPVAG